MSANVPIKKRTQARPNRVIKVAYRNTKNPRAEEKVSKCFHLRGLTGDLRF